jgi:acyl-CoA synthetase (AMP-forming)/AMP-acid ligase II
MTIDAYATQLRAIIAQSEPVVLLAERQHVGLLERAAGGRRVTAVEDLDGPAMADPSPAAPEAAVFVQYSSGATAEPHGCILTAGAIARQLQALSLALDIDPDVDMSVDWLPLSHDMGLFGCLLMTAYWTGTRQALSSPDRFLTAPQSWFGDCVRFGATVSAGPNFALEVAAKVANTIPVERAPMRRLVVGGERVDAATLRRAAAAIGPRALPATALTPAYGLAEAVLAVTMAPIGAGPRIAHVSRDALANGMVEILDTADSEVPGGVSSVVSAGVPLSGASVDVIGDADVGAIRVRCSSLSEGYLGLPDETDRRFTPAGLLTGDLGFMLDKHVYVTGRLDDLLVVAGRNVYARDIEAAILEIGAIRPGSCAVVQLLEADEPRLAAVVEPVDHHPDFSVMASQMTTAARASTGVRLSECVFLPTGTFPKTPSGKTRRFRCQELAAEQGLAGAVHVRS